MSGTLFPSQAVDPLLPPNYKKFAIPATERLAPVQPDWSTVLDVLPVVYWPQLLQPVLYEVLFHLDVIDIIRFRRVCKFWYYVSHERALWAYLLRNADPTFLPPLPPLKEIKPLVDGVPANLNAADIERILVRAASLRANFARQHPRPLRVWAHETFARVHDLALLPGGQHLVAMQRDPKTDEYRMVLYELDQGRHGAEAMIALPLAGTPVVGTLQAKYLTVSGVPGITVTCIQTRKERRRNPDGTSSIVLLHQCRVAHLCMETMDKLACAYPPDSPQYIWLESTLPPACKWLSAPPPMHARLCAPTVGMLCNKPFLVFAKETGPKTNELWYQSLEGGEPEVHTVKPPIDRPSNYESADWRIRSIRTINDPPAVLVASQYILTSNGIEKFTHPVPFGHRLDLFPLDRPKTVNYFDIEASPNIRIHNAHSRGYTIRMTDPVALPAREHSIYAAAGVEETRANSIVHVYPPRPPHPPEDPENPHPRVPLYSSAPELSNYDPWTRILPATHYPLCYRVAPGPVNAPADAFGGATAVARQRVLGVYALPEESWTQDAPPSERAYAQELEGVMKRLAAYGEETEVSALAWDGAVGRLVVAYAQGSSLQVFDFAKVPRLDLQGDRWPIPLKSLRTSDGGMAGVGLLRSPLEIYHGSRSNILMPPMEPVFTPQYASQESFLCSRCSSGCVPPSALMLCGPA
ncbi:hypothetical protein C8Q77DRAFT_1069007 [Trametes polyzona]|nr:hypothetical protein C8Q77DRAFT_1069007 [Trametes polyzona]